MLSICYTVVRRQWQFTKASLVWFQEVNRISHYVLFHCSDAYWSLMPLCLPTKSTPLKYQLVPTCGLKVLYHQKISKGFQIQDFVFPLKCWLTDINASVCYSLTSADLPRDKFDCQFNVCLLRNSPRNATHLNTLESQVRHPHNNLLQCNQSTINICLLFFFLNFSLKAQNADPPDKCQNRSGSRALWRQLCWHRLHYVWIPCKNLSVHFILSKPLDTFTEVLLGTSYGKLNRFFLFQTQQLYFVICWKGCQQRR